LFQPEDPFAPPAAAFDEPWHAQVLALTDSLVRSGFFSANDWANVLGAELAQAEANGNPDTQDSYFNAALTALEKLLIRNALLSPEALSQRKLAWTEAYRQTPHGQPVTLDAVS
jgi:nitrile hydratase accessory protein